MENNIELEDYFEEYENILVDCETHEIVGPIESYIYEGDEEHLYEIRCLQDELGVVIQALEKQAALIAYDVDYYRAQSKVVGTIGLKKKYVLSSYKQSLITSKLNYYIGVKNAIDNVLYKGKELKK